MSEGYKIRSLSEIVNEILSTVRSYYDAEYAYYIEKTEETSRRSTSGAMRISSGSVIG